MIHKLTWSWLMCDLLNSAYKAGCLHCTVACLFGGSKTAGGPVSRSAPGICCVGQPSSLSGHLLLHQEKIRVENQLLPLCAQSKVADSNLVFSLFDMSYEERKV